MFCFVLKKRLVFLLFFMLFSFSGFAEKTALRNSDGASVALEQLSPDLVQNMYQKYLEAVSDDNNFESLRRLFVRKREYKIHVKKLEEVNGYKRHNLLIKEENQLGNPRIYINNPVESHIPNSYLTIEEFKKALSMRSDRLRNISDTKQSFIGHLDGKLKVAEDNKHIHSQIHKKHAKNTSHSNVTKLVTERLYSKFYIKPFSFVEGYRNIHLKENEEKSKVNASISISSNSDLHKTQRLVELLKATSVQLTSSPKTSNKTKNDSHNIKDSNNLIESNIEPILNVTLPSIAKSNYKTMGEEYHITSDESITNSTSKTKDLSESMFESTAKYAREQSKNSNFGLISRDDIPQFVKNIDNSMTYDDFDRKKALRLKQGNRTSDGENIESSNSTKAHRNDTTTTTELEMDNNTLLANNNSTNRNESDVNNIQVETQNIRNHTNIDVVDKSDSKIDENIKMETLNDLLVSNTDLDTNKVSSVDETLVDTTETTTEFSELTTAKSTWRTLKRPAVFDMRP